MELEREVRGSQLIVRAAGELDLYSADEFRRRVDAWLAETKAHRLILNLRRVTFIDSTGLGAILGRLRRLRQEGKTMALVQPAAPTRVMLELAGLRGVMEVFPSEQKALEGHAAAAAQGAVPDGS